jgi:molecular chaperone HscB
MKSINFFEILGLEKKYDIDLKLLEKRYFEFQQKNHPDNSELSSDLAFKYSSIANDAYKTLKNKRLRGEYLLNEQNIFVNSEKDNLFPENSLLAEVFLIREEIEDISSEDEFAFILEKNNKNLNESYNKLAKLFDKNLYKEAAHELIKIRYLEKIKEEIQSKIKRKPRA